MHKVHVVLTNHLSISEQRIKRKKKLKLLKLIVQNLNLMKFMLLLQNSMKESMNLPCKAKGSSQRNTLSVVNKKLVKIRDLKNEFNFYY
jgi:ABC-type histidine transport system ATPase subunit